MQGCGPTEPTELLIILLASITVHNSCLSTQFLLNLVFVNETVKICENAFTTQQITVTFTVS